MGQSSYDKIYEAMWLTKQVQSLVVDSFKEKLGKSHVVDVSFFLKKPEVIGKPAQATPRFKVMLPNGTVSTEDGRVWIGIDIDKSVARHIVEQLFGVKGGVPTYFCKKDVVLGDKTHKRAISFREWLDSKIRMSFRAEILETEARIQAEVQDWLASELVARRQREFLVKSAMADIKMTLAAYDHLGKDVIKNALEEFLVHSVFEYADD